MRGISVFTSIEFVLAAVPFVIGLVAGRWWALPVAVATVIYLAFAVLPRDGGEGSYEISIGFIVVFAFFFTLLYILAPVFWATCGVAVHRGIRQAWLKWGGSTR